MIALVFVWKGIPDEDWLNRLAQVDDFMYEKFIVTDLETTLIPLHLKKKFPKLSFLQTHKVYVASSGYWDTSFADRRNLQMMATANPCAWEKAFWFHKQMHWGERFQHVWFCEDDVMFPRRDVFSFLDWKYPTADLLCADVASQEQDPQWPWWSHAMGSGPFCHAMLCAFRISGKLMEHVHDFAREHRKLFYAEMMIPSFANHHNMVRVSPPELRKIVHRWVWQDSDIEPLELAHPIKDPEQQKRIWKMHSHR